MSAAPRENQLRIGRERALIYKTFVPVRTAQAAMRHSDPSLTANVYTDPKLLDVAGAVASLPDLPLAAIGAAAVAVAAR